MIITKHQYIDKYPIALDSKKLIVGTIHPHNHDKFALPFFYGNVTSLWTLLSDAFPNDLKKPFTLEGILHFLNVKKIAVSDTIITCARKKLSALDNDLIPIELNTGMIESIKKSEITEVLFTSGFGKNSAFKLFYVDILKQKITDEIKQNRGLMLDAKHFGKPIKLTVLYSPAGTANLSLSKSNLYAAQKHKYVTSKRPIYDFKVDYYRDKFGT